MHYRCGKNYIYNVSCARSPFISSCLSPHPGRNPCYCCFRYDDRTKSIYSETYVKHNDRRTSSDFGSSL